MNMKRHIKAHTDLYEHVLIGVFSGRWWGAQINPIVRYVVLANG